MTCAKAQCPGCGCIAGRSLSCLPAKLTSRLIADRARRKYNRGEAVFYQGNPALALYSIQSGRVRLSRAVKGGEVTVGIREVGDLLGLRAILGAFPYGVTARTVEPAVICTIPGPTFMDLLRSSPDFSIRLLRELAIEFRMTEEQMARRAQESVGTRVARLLASLAAPREAPLRNRGGSVRMDRDEMAVLVGTTRETLSRALHEMARRQILGLSRHEIQILDPQALRAQFE